MAKKAISIGQVKNRDQGSEEPDICGKNNYVDYKRVDLLNDYTNRFQRIRPAWQTDLPKKCQKAMTKAVKRARQLALMPYTLEHLQ